MSYKSYRDEREKEILTKLQENLIKAGFLVEDAAKRLCLVDTGRLRASISTNWTGSGMSRGEIKKPVKTTQSDDGVSDPTGKDFEVVVGTNVEYARAVEFGAIWGNSPFLYPALEMNKGKIEELLKE